MNNSVFGKTMENIRKKVDVRLVNDREKARKLAFVKIFDENLIAINMKKKSLTFDKPIYCGMSILEISKTLMYKFHYKYIKPKYGDLLKLLFSDTDSLCYEIESDDFFKDISGDLKKWFDKSNFSRKHP